MKFRIWDLVLLTIMVACLFGLYTEGRDRRVHDRFHEMWLKRHHETIHNLEQGYTYEGTPVGQPWPRSPLPRPDGYLGGSGTQKDPFIVPGWQHRPFPEPWNNLTRGKGCVCQYDGRGNCHCSGICKCGTDDDTIPAGD